MASLRKIGKNYYARVILTKNGQRKERAVPLCTRDLSIATTRLFEVSQQQKSIKGGVDVSFPWMNEAHSLQVIEFRLDQAWQTYIDSRKLEGLRKATLDIYGLSYISLTSVIKDNPPVEKISTNDLERYKKVMLPDYSRNTINMRLRAIRTFFQWLYDRELIKDKPRVFLLRIPKSTPRYISDKEFKKICKKARKIDPFLEDVFIFYRDIGCRLSEPFRGSIKGKYLTVDPESAKAGRTRDIPIIDDALMRTLVSMRAQTHLNAGNGKYRDGSLRPNRKTHEYKYYSKMFKKCCTKAKIKDTHFHDLRHTFAVRQWLITGDIFWVSNRMGHASVTVTEVYARIDLGRLQQDFPKLVRQRLRVDSTSVKSIKAAAH